MLPEREPNDHEIYMRTIVQTRHHVPNHFELQEVCNAVRYSFWKKGLNVIVEHTDELSPYYGHARITIRW